ncbi:hypothetical protein [Bacillus sp. FJAT-27245]|uniref:hypothetical protein n=1 Tax=Bacillus sp. FJAT-27245 TaxID=1684144 RepID=UPI0006A7590E|nr:hypothetical protein [Bacillus sp. FJAT-27245]
MASIEMMMKLADYLTVPVVVLTIIVILLTFRSIIAIFLPIKTRLVQCTNCIELIDETALTCKYCKTVMNRAEKKPNIFIRILHYKGFDRTYDWIRDFHKKNNEPRV